MAVPKKRTSKAKTNKRKFVWKTKVLKRCQIIPLHKELRENVFDPYKEAAKMINRGFQVLPIEQEISEILNNNKNNKKVEIKDKIKKNKNNKNKYKRKKTTKKTTKKK